MADDLAKMTATSKNLSNNSLTDDQFNADDFRIDNYDPSNPINDQFEIDNYSAIDQNMGRLKRFLSWIGLYDSGEQLYKIADWSAADNLELYNLDQPGTNEQENRDNLWEILKLEKRKRIKKAVFNIIIALLVLSLFLYITINLVIVNKEYKHLKETSGVLEAAETVTSLGPEQGTSTSVFVSSTDLVPSSTRNTLTSSFKQTTQASTIKKSSSKATSTTAKPNTKTSKTKTKTRSPTKTKTKTSKPTSTSLPDGILSHLNDIWEDAKDFGEEVLESVGDIVDEISEKIQGLSEGSNKEN